MRAAMMEADVGDEQMGLDPTVNSLCDRVAAMMGKEAAMFLPSGTMCNEIAILVHCRPGDDVLAHESSHIIGAEGGAPAALAGVRIQPLTGPRGMFELATVREALYSRGRYTAPQTLLCVEQTSNVGGGAVWPLAQLQDVAELSHAAGLATHMDGARLLNATEASGVGVGVMCAAWDSVWLDFTKGLGAPMGAVLAGDSAFIDAAWRWKQRLGGAMRQAGFAAAACQYALDHNVRRLKDDHRRAARLADGLAEVPGLQVTPPETNLVYCDVSQLRCDAATFVAHALNEGLALSVMGRTLVRAGVYLNISDQDIELAVQIISRIVERNPFSRLT